MKEKATAFDYGDDTRDLVLSIVHQAIYDFMETMIEDGFAELNTSTIDDYASKIYDPIVAMIKDPTEYWYPEVRFCDTCGKLVREGYCLNAEEYYCSDECLHEKYSEGEYLAMYAGLDNTDPEEVARALTLSDIELADLNSKNDSQCYFSEWEVEK